SVDHGGNRRIQIAMAEERRGIERENTTWRKESKMAAGRLRQIHTLRADENGWVHVLHRSNGKLIKHSVAGVDRGIVAIITNHSYLDNPTFRGMRQSLVRTFDQIWILDLHGSTKPKELAPEGAENDNVFDIQKG